MIFVNEFGFQKKTLPTIKSELETSFEEAFGEIDLGAEGPFGQIIGLLSKREADLWDGAEEIYISRDPSQATGISLDNIASETGIKRIAAVATRVEKTLLFGTEGTVVPAGSKSKMTVNPVTFSLLSDITITRTNTNKLSILPNEPGGGGEDFTLTLNGVNYVYTTSGGDTSGDVIDGLIVLVDAGSWAGTAVNVDGQLVLTDLDTAFSVSVSTNMAIESIAITGTFDADETGPIPVPAGDLIEISTPITGWDEVLNTEAGTTGRNVETDAEFRIRRASTFLSGAGTDENIRRAILNEVADVISCSVTSNRTMATDGDGRPPKSFEAVVEGGGDDEIASEIWTSQPSGIESYGTKEIIVQDSEGNPQSVFFSRPTNIYIFVKVTRSLYSEEVYPADGDAQIKAAIVEWALLNFRPGVNVIRQRLSIPIYTVEGIQDILIELDSNVDPGAIPTYTEANIAIAARETAVFDITRIEVEVM